MPRYVAFLRGMNLGHRRIKNAELAAAFEALGTTEVAPFLASGNVIFTAGDDDPARLAGTLETGLERELGYPVPTFLRTAAEVRSIAALEPFPPRAIAAGGKPQVALLSGVPGREARSAALALATDDDRLAFGPRELHWLPSGGILDSELDLRALEKLLGLWTLRTRNTIARLAARLDG